MSDGNVLYYDLLVYIFKMALADGHALFKSDYTVPTGDQIYHQNVYKNAFKVSKLWLKACRAAGLIGFLYDYPLLRFVHKDIQVDVLNKYGMTIYVGGPKRRLGLCMYVGNIKNKSCSVRIFPDSGTVSWAGVDKITMTVNEHIIMCRVFGRVFGNESPIARKLIYWPSEYKIRPDDYAILESEIKQWLLGASFGGEAYKM
jgi:hypothetical protein